MRFESQNGGFSPSKIWQRCKIFQKFILLWALQDSEVDSQGREPPGLKEASVRRTALLALYDKSTEQEDGNPVDLRWNTHG